MLPPRAHPLHTTKMALIYMQILLFITNLRSQKHLHVILSRLAHQNITPQTTWYQAARCALLEFGSGSQVMSPCTSTTLLRGSTMLQQTYAAALWYLFNIMAIGHTDNSSSETVSGNESSVTTASFGNHSKHASSSETAKDCSTKVSGKNHASCSITANKISSETVSGNESSATTASFGNHSKHASSSETAKDYSTTVSGKNHASCSNTASKISSETVSGNETVR